MAIKKTSVKKTTKPSAINSKPTLGTFSWLFTRDRTQGCAKWHIRSALFTLVILAFIFFIGTIGLMDEIAAATQGGVQSQFWDTAGFMLTLVGRQIFGFIITTAIIYLIGIFIFMPRKYLGRRDFMSIFLTYMFLLILSLVIFFTALHAVKPVSEYQSLVQVILILYVPILAFAIGFIVALVCYAKKLNVSGLRLLLSFPIGWSIYEYSALFLPTSDKDKTIAIKYKWYERFINFLLNTVKGQLCILAFLLASIISTLAFGKTPLYEIVIFAVFGILYFAIGKNKLAQNTNLLSTIAVLLNLAILVMFIAFLGTGTPIHG